MKDCFLALILGKEEDMVGGQPFLQLDWWYWPDVTLVILESMAMLVMQ
jgi:hypothetical protein